jgi:hypothetical protein
MRAAIHDASGRQDPGGPSPVLGRGGERNNRPHNPGTAELEGEIAGLGDRSTKELRLAWRKLHRTGPPLGLSRDLMIRMFANNLQERADGGPNLALRRRLQTLAGELEQGAVPFDPGIVLKTGTTLVRQWRGHTHTVLVREGGFEYDGQRPTSPVICMRCATFSWLPRCHPNFWVRSVATNHHPGARPGKGIGTLVAPS